MILEDLLYNIKTKYSLFREDIINAHELVNNPHLDQQDKLAMRQKHIEFHSSIRKVYGNKSYTIMKTLMTNMC